MIFFFFIFLFLNLISSYFSVVFIPIILLIFIFFYSNFYFLSSLCFDLVISDEFFLFLNLISSFIFIFALCSSRFFIFNIKNLQLFIIIYIFIIVIVFLTFSSSNFFFVYVRYESRLLPIIFIIIKWGSYPERSVRSLILLGYTVVFRLPFLFFLFYFFNTFHSFYLLFPSQNLLYHSFFLFLSFFVFAVKLPLYGLHFWLPIAHVEAPTFGSIILAGILLKLGGLGLIRLSYLFSFFPLRFSFLSFFFFSLVYVGIVCSFQSDLKRLIAYSSVVHIITIPFLLLAYSILSFKSILIVIVFHGFRSSVLFILVGLLYEFMLTRQVILLRGLLLINPLLCLIIILSFFFTLPAPPFLSFFTEVLFIISSFPLDFSIVIPFLFLSFFSLVYNLNWLVRVVFSYNININYSFSSSNLLFIDFRSIIILIFFSFRFAINIFLF